jgi:catechol 2,3-dioxygenase
MDADIFPEAGISINSGPHKHAVQQTFSLHVRGPVGNRVEVCKAIAQLVLTPDWQPIVWTEEEREKGQAWGTRTVEDFHIYGTARVEDTM